jgi:hypothetical protein
LEKIHTKYLKIILGVHKNVSNIAVYGETGRYPLFIRQKVKVFKYWLKIIQMSENSLVRMIYSRLLSLNNCGFTTWATNVESLINSAGLSYLWINQSCTKHDIVLFKSTIHENYVKLWQKCISNVALHPKLRTFCTFKADFAMEAYLVKVRDFKLRCIISRFRLSNHVLAIEKGRHVRPIIPADQRYCKVCNTDKVEDEEHFLCVCPKYEILRNQFYDIRNTFNANSNSFIDIMSCDRSSFHLGLFLKKMFKMRQTYLNM